MFNFFVAILCLVGGIFQFSKGNMNLVIIECIFCFLNFLFALPWIKKLIKTFQEKRRK